MADESKKASSDEDGSEESDNEEEEEFLPGFDTFQDYSKQLLSMVVKATRECHSLPAADEDYEYYSSYPSFTEFTAKMGQRITKSIARITKYHHITGPWPSGGIQLGSSSKSHDHGDLFEAVVEANDTLLEQVDNLLDEATGVKKAGQALSGTLDSKKVEQSLQRGHVKKVSYIHSSNMMRPQLKWADKIDNSNTPFRPIIKHKPNALKPLPSIDVQDGATISSFISAVRDKVTSIKSYGHPYRYELEKFEPITEQLEINDPQHPGALSDVPLTMVTSVEQLQELSKLLIGVKEFAVDLEHHSYRSFLGITCLMQLSTRNHDYIIDILELRDHMHILNESFTNPRIVKVLHGANWDIIWLQRDLGLYVVNMFDTHQASRMLQLPKNSLAFLLKYCCDVDADKRYQLADWRIRPLPEEMLHYAREDTHYLLYIYDRMRNELIRRSNNDNNLLRTVISRSTEICLKEERRLFKLRNGDDKVTFYHSIQIKSNPYSRMIVKQNKILSKKRQIR
ncbi:exosome complex component 10-like isoform X1 [Dysidea avara]|uniref:exosome complex component 10-like isoform X1 n=1 Tax=Dysidea avara TaxID=196820 RepID=UPI0033290467